jgi:osmotically-inducible protein OsmY
MTIRILASFLALCLLAGFCLGADKAAVVTDDTITDQVRIKLAGDAVVKGGALTVDCKNGVVTLGGIVDADKQKNRATKLAKKVKGVKQVVNNITLKERNTGK